MNEEKNSGKGFLQDKLGDFRVDPPENVWAGISARLGNRNRRGRVIVMLSAAATIALAVTLGINFFDRDLPGSPAETESITGTESMAETESITENGSRSELASTSESEAVSRTGAVSGTEDGVEAPSPPETDATTVYAARSEAAGGTEADGTAATAALTGEPLDAESFPPVRLEEPVAQGIHLPADTTIPARLLTEENLLAEDDLLADAFPEVDRAGRDPGWSIGAAVTPIYSFRDTEGQLMAVSSDHESGIISYAGGIHVSYRTTSRLAIESGVLFNKMGIDISAPGIQVFKKSFDFAPLGEEASNSNILAVTNSVGNIVSQSGDIYVNSYKAYEFTAANATLDNLDQEAYADQGIRQNFDYLELPFNVRYSVVGRDLEVQLVGGMSTNFLLNSNVTMPTSSGQREIGYLTNIRTVNYSGNAGVGVIYHVKDHFSLHLEPRFRYFINSINDQSLPSTRPYTFGIYTGLNYRF